MPVESSGRVGHSDQNQTCATAVKGCSLMAGRQTVGKRKKVKEHPELTDAPDKFVITLCNKGCCHLKSPKTAIITPPMS